MISIYEKVKSTGKIVKNVKKNHKVSLSAHRHAPHVERCHKPKFWYSTWIKENPIERHKPAFQLTLQSDKARTNAMPQSPGKYR